MAPKPHQPDSDVRMRGFRHRTTVADALAWVDSQSNPMSGESVGLEHLAGRVLLSPVISQADVPGFDRAMMDGFALRASDTSGASPYSNLEANLIGQALPGTPFVGSVDLGQCVRIMTGAPMPVGADAVLPAEQCEANGDVIRLMGEVSPGKHVGRRGEDVQAGQQVLPIARRLRPQDVGVLSSIGLRQAEVVRRPVVKIVITGDELLPPGSTPVGSKIADANGPMLLSLVRRDGGLANASEIIPDQPDAILDAMRQPADVVLVSGGSSVGQEDHAPVLLAEHGELAIHGVTMRPSSPAGMGRLADSLVFLLPGNPVSCLCAYDFFAARAIRRLGGRVQEWPDWPYRSSVGRLTRKLVSLVGRTDYARVTWDAPGMVEPLAVSGASVLTSTTRADGFVVIPPDSEGCAAGSEVTVYEYDDLGPVHLIHP